MESVCVFKGNIVIAFYGSKANEKELVRLLPDSKTEQKISGGSTYSYYHSSNLTFAAVTTSKISNKEVLEFLSTLSRRFFAQFGSRIHSSVYHSLDQDFFLNFTDFITSFENNANKTKQIIQSLNDAESNLNSALNKATMRNESLGLLDDKASSIYDSSNDFMNQSRRLKSHMKCNHYRNLAIKITIVFLLITLLIAYLCGGFDLKPNCR